MHFEQTSPTTAVMEAPEVHNHHHGHSGHRWFDIAAAVCAIVVSLVSLYLAIHHGQVMQEMADANQRMVTAASWPSLSYQSSNLNAAGEPAIRLSLANKGVGPARIESMQLLYKDRPVGSNEKLLLACCMPAAGLVTSNLQGEILRPGETVDFLNLPRSARNAEAWDALDRERGHIEFKVCYCSVFDECFVAGSHLRKASKVKACPADWSAFN